MKPPGAVRIGKVGKAHGVRGGVKVHLYGGAPDLLRAEMGLMSVDGAGHPETLTVRQVRANPRGALIEFEGVESREAARALTGRDLFVDRSLLPDPEEGSYYWSDLMGMAVVTDDNQALGRIVAIIPTGGNDVYVVQDRDNETLIPALEGVVLSVDLAGKTMRVSLPEGL